MKGRTWTYSVLSSKDSSEECISVSNLEEHINEHLLWHGTSKTAAEKIAEKDFYIPTGKETDPVPPGAVPGQSMTVRLPDGREVQVQVPAGAGPGTQLEIEA
eukprot:g23201.t1